MAFLSGTVIMVTGSLDGDFGNILILSSCSVTDSCNLATSSTVVGVAHSGTEDEDGAI